MLIAIAKEENEKKNPGYMLSSEYNVSNHMAI